MTASSLFLGVLFGSIGFGYLMYGRKQRAVVPIGCGLLLLVVPYFIGNAALLLAVGCALAALPFVYKR